METVAFYTLGCKVNYFETESMKSLFEQHGYRVVNFNKRADVYVINTCTVTHTSDSKSRQMIRRARRRSPDAVIAVTGCYAQVYTEELERMPDIDLITGTRDRLRLPALVEEVRRGGPRVMVTSFEEEPCFEDLPFYRDQGRQRAFLKIQDGCSHSCSYCVVPLARGPARSMPPHRVVEEVHRIADMGYKELVLTGVHLGQYGIEGSGITLAGIIKKIEHVPGIRRIRLSSLEPLDFTGELVEAISASSRICSHLHIPLQSGDDEILCWMNRPYNTAEYAFLVARLRNLIPELAVSTDIIVGFPGETEEHHWRSLKFVRKISFSRMHVFKYSSRPGTASCSFKGQVPPEAQNRRSKEMEEVALEMAADYRRSFLGTRQEMLVEKVYDNGEVEGLTEHYLRVKVPVDDLLQNGTGALVQVELLEEDSESDLIHGRLLNNPV